MQNIKNELKKVTDNLQVQAQTESQPLRTSELALAIKGLKVCQISVEELKQSIRYCMILVGIRAQNIPVDEEKAVLLDFIRENFGNHTPEEIKLAFKMAVSGRLSVDPNCYENFSCQYFGKIMAAYRAWSEHEVRQIPKPVQKMHELNPPKADWTKFWHDCVEAARNGTIESKIIPAMVYDWLVEKKYLQLDVPERKELFQMALISYRAEIMNDIYFNNAGRVFENELEQIDSGKLSENLHLRITNKAKVMACKNYALTQI